MIKKWDTTMQVIVTIIKMNMNMNINDSKGLQITLISKESMARSPFATANIAEDLQKENWKKERKKERNKERKKEKKKDRKKEIKMKKR